MISKSPETNRKDAKRAKRYSNSQSLGALGVLVVSILASGLLARGKRSEDKALNWETFGPMLGAASSGSVGEGALAPSAQTPPQPSIEEMSYDRLIQAARDAEKEGEILKAEQFYLAAAGRAERENPKDLRYSGILHTLGFFYHFHGMFAQAEETFQKMIKVLEDSVGPDDPNVANALIDLTGVYNFQSKFDMSEPLYKRALAIREKTNGPDDSTVAEILKYYADALRNLNRKDEADQLEARSKAILAKQQK